MNQNTFNNYIEAGKISKKVKEDIKKYLRLSNVISIDKLYDQICKIITSYNCTLIFPPNINGPGVVCHDTASLKDSRVITKGVLKIDIGLEYKTCFIDTAFSYYITKEYAYVELVYDNYFTAIEELLKPGLEIYTISKFTEDYFKDENLNIVEELCGHTIKPPILHAQPIFAHHTKYYEKNVEKELLTPWQIFTLEPHVTLKSAKLVQSSAEIYLENNKLYSIKTKNPGNNVTNWYPVYILNQQYKNESFLYEHTYLVTNSKVLRLS
jgi:methionine aminopeptidase